MKKLKLVIGASLREQMRWAGQHLYTLLILSPLVFGISYMTVSRLADEAPQWQPTLRLSLILSVVFVLSLVGLSLTRAIGEIYHLRRPESLLDAMPLSFETLLHAALLKRVTRILVLGLVLLIARALFSTGTVFDTSALLPLLLFIALTALAQTLAAVNWIHWGHTKNKVAAMGAMLSILLSATLAGLLLVNILRPGMSAGWNKNWLLIIGFVWLIVLYFLTLVSHQRWRASDIEFAKRIQAGNRLSAFGSSFLEKKFERGVAVQLARDLQLTFRGFSSAVYVALFISVLLLATLATVLMTGWLPAATAEAGWFEATWLPSVMAAKIASVMVSAACATLVAVLVAYQLPYLWLERAAGATGRQMWETKLWYARLVSLFSPLLVWLVALLSGTVPLFYAVPLLLECVWLWWLVSTLTGALAFEVPDRPELAIVLMISSAAVFGLFVTLFWPIGIALYALNLIRGLIDRGHARANYCLILEGD